MHLNNVISFYMCDCFAYTVKYKICTQKCAATVVENFVISSIFYFRFETWVVWPFVNSGLILTCNGEITNQFNLCSRPDPDPSKSEAYFSALISRAAPVSRSSDAQLCLIASCISKPLSGGPAGSSKKQHPSVSTVHHRKISDGRFWAWAADLDPRRKYSLDENWRINQSIFHFFWGICLGAVSLSVIRVVRNVFRLP